LPTPQVSHCSLASSAPGRGLPPVPKATLRGFPSFPCSPRSLSASTSTPAYLVSLASPPSTPNPQHPCSSPLHAGPSSCQPPHRPPPCRSLLTPASTLTPPLHRLPPHAGSSRWSPHRPPLCHPPRQPPLCDVLGTFSISAGGQRPWCGSGCGKKRECVDMRDEGRGLV
jgi:hypothetical protein